MAVFKMSEWEYKKPEWSRFSNCGLYKLSRGEKEEDYHFHDCDEYFIITEGKGILLLEGKEYSIVAEDCVCIPMGGKHQILEVLEDLTLVWIYDELRGERRKGHIPVKGEEKEVLYTKIVKLGRWKDEKPFWSRLTDLGILFFPKGKVEMDYHFHDCHEYYFLTRGKLLITIENKEIKMEEGDVGIIRKGEHHKVLEASEDSTLLWLQDELMGEKRYGHLHDA